MALSASFDFTMTRNDAITEALEQLGVLGEGETPTAAQLTADGRTLNLMLKAWQNKEFTQNLIRRFYVFLNIDQREYTLHTTAASSDASCFNFYADTLAADYADGGTSLTVTTGTGATDADEIIVMPDSGAWDASVGDIESGGGTTTLVVPDLNIDAESGNYYYNWTTRATRPVNILYAERHLLPTSVGEQNVISTVSHPVKVGERRDWQELSAKHTEGATTMVWFNEAGITDDWNAATLHVWPEPSNIGEYLEIWGQYTIDDMDDAGDNFNLPSRWYQAVAYNLAKHLAGKYGVSAGKKQYIAALAQESLDDAEMAESDTQFQFMPDNRWRR
jgi:hypothetical protein